MPPVGQRCLVALYLDALRRRLGKRGAQAVVITFAWSLLTPVLMSATTKIIVIAGLVGIVIVNVLWGLGHRGVVAVLWRLVGHFRGSRRRISVGIITIGIIRTIRRSHIVTLRWMAGDIGVMLVVLLVVLWLGRCGLVVGVVWLAGVHPISPARRQHHLQRTKQNVSIYKTDSSLEDTSFQFE